MDALSHENNLSLIIQGLHQIKIYGHPHLLRLKETLIDVIIINELIIFLRFNEDNNSKI
jgi:hypothetical protein